VVSVSFPVCISLSGVNTDFQSCLFGDRVGSGETGTESGPAPPAGAVHQIDLELRFFRSAQISLVEFGGFNF
jgi:hypothetical protein